MTKLLLLLSSVVAGAASAAADVPGRAVATRWLVGVQMRVTPWDYATPAAFEKRAADAIGAALADPRLRPEDAKVVVLPEWAGTWLALADEPASVYNAAGKTQAIESLIRGDRLFLAYLVAHSIIHGRKPFEPDAVLRALFRYKAKRARAVYVDAGMRLARRYQVTLVFGSLVLPGSGRDSRLYNTSYTFGPDGSVLAVVRKVHPTASEQGFTAAAPVAELSPYQTPAGRLGTMICADGWFGDVYERLRGAELLAQPSFGEQGLAGFDRRWGGYSGAPNPADVDAADLNDPSFTERRAWRKYSLVGRMHLAGALYGVNPFLAGKFWDIEIGGYGVGVDLTKPAGVQTLEVATDSQRDTFIVVEAPFVQQAAGAAR